MEKLVWCGLSLEWKTDEVMDNDRAEDDDGWCDTVDESCEIDTKSVEWSWRSEWEVDFRGEEMSGEKNDL